MGLDFIRHEYSKFLTYVTFVSWRCSEYWQTETDRRTKWAMDTFELHYLQTLQSLEQWDKRIVVIFVSKIAESAGKNSPCFVGSYQADDPEKMMNRLQTYPCFVLLSTFFYPSLYPSALKTSASHNSKLGKGRGRRARQSLYPFLPIMCGLLKQGLKQWQKWWIETGLTQSYIMKKKQKITKIQN